MSIPGALDALERISREHCVSPKLVLSKSRRPPIVRARDNFIHALVSAGFSYSEIGRRLGFDHTSVRTADGRHTERGLSREV